ncbi:MAG TPA: coproporphyrinogen III oxidase family protein, partial [Steroidobacteraceae bacterium]|nr:coproporphyrinogen III oxidase family protein [Steroidobacteraceae bacterium]
KSSRYFEALRQEIRRYHEDGFTFADVYVGGGTPTVVPDELGETLELIRSLWPIRTLSVETNPNDLREEVFRVLDASGVTRLSVGVQTFDDELLRRMDRYEKYGSAAVIRERLQAAQGRYHTLNVDMIFNLPGQSLELLERDLDVLIDLGADQASFYPLMTAPTVERRMNESMGDTDPSRRLMFYERILARMLPTYRANSAWCFSRIDGMFDEYIIDQDEYIGVGSGAFSYVGGAMYSTTFSLNQYCERIARGQTAITQGKAMSLRERMRYDYLVKLFGLELSRDYIESRYGWKFWTLMAPELAAMRLVGATRHDKDALRLTQRGMYCWILMMAEFFNAVNAFREQMRAHIRAELEDDDAPVAPLRRMTRTPETARRSA